MIDDVQNEDVIFDPDDETSAIAHSRAKIEKLKQELEKAKQERQEYLDGWQRAQADMVNVRREALSAAERARAAATLQCVEALIPALDSFDMAIASDSWVQVDQNWRVGVESIRSQLQDTLRGFGVEIYGKVGDTFDPSQYEAVHTVDGGTSHTVARVIRSGYRLKDRVIRPAHVSIFS